MTADPLADYLAAVVFTKWDHATPEERFWAKVRKTETCWLWTGSCRYGYGRFNVDTRKGVSAHRYAYELAKGPIPDGLQIDHLCRVRHCVRPEHLEAVTGHVNILRAAAAITHCPQSHPYDEVNTWRDKRGKRYCRECMRVKCLARYHARKVASV